jgi:hypothetical protein
VYKYSAALCARAARRASCAIPAVSTALLKLHSIAISYGIPSWLCGGFYCYFLTVTNFIGGSVMRVVEIGCSFMNSSITSLILGEERNSGSL